MKVIVHVGTPRTASCCLQTAYFPAVAAERPGFVWAGALQPARRRPSRLYGALVEALSQEGRENRLREALADISADTAIFSCPGVLAERPGDGIGWKTKVARLGRALAGLDHRLVVTVRDPMDSAFSYFVDLCHALPRRKRNFLSQLGTERFEIFRYARLFGLLETHFAADRIAVVGFDDIVSGRLAALDAAIGVPSLERELPRRNTRCRLDGAIRTDRLSLGQTLACYLPVRISGAANSMLTRLPDAIRDAKVGPHLVIPQPTPAEAARIAAFYAPHVAFLRDRYGIAADRRLTSNVRPPIAAGMIDEHRAPIGGNHSVGLA